jgi:outer membrane protein OmpA-like peptidoglycan-associated protein
MKKKILLSAITCCLLGLVVLEASAQFRDQGMGGGIGFGGTIPQTSQQNDQTRFLARAYLRFPFVKSLFAEVGAGYGKLAGDSKGTGTPYETKIVPADVRLLFSPFNMQSVAPYLYAGAGLTYFENKTVPTDATAGIKGNGYAATFPVGLGVAFKLSDNVAFDLSGGYHYSTTEELDAIKDTKKDAYWTFLLGLTWVGEGDNADPDHDGLTNKEERLLGTDPHKADTDGDGLSDGDEVKKYNTNPLKVDSDGDGLSDYDEVMKYKTDPNKADTDGDGLNDGDEILKYKTDPLKADTDGDGLSDGDEVLKYKTDPLKADTDGDGLSDGDEVLKYKTDPLKADTDGGSVPDGVEVQRGTNPLDPSDDVPKKKEELKVEVGKAIALEGIAFKSGSATILPESETSLEKAYNTLSQNPEINVEIRGYTDNVGNKAKNVKLSADRAAAVKTWLVKKGVDAARITTKGFGPENPVGDNKTAEGKAKNRRIEFFRTK